MFSLVDEHGGTIVKLFCQKTMQCYDLDLKLSGNTPQGYFVEVVESPLNCRSDPHSLVFPPDVAPRVKAVRQRRSDRRQNVQLGTALFEALLPTRIRDMWTESKGMAVKAGGLLRLRLDIRTESLIKIPWEIIHDGKEFLSLSSQYAVVRYLHRNATSHPVQIDGPLKLLLVTSTPSDLPALSGIKRELEMIRQSLSPGAKSNRVRFVTLEHATSPSLHAGLEQSYHVMHYMGHGAFVDNRGYLILENGKDSSNWKEAEAIGDLLRNKKLQLLVLNACDTAIPSSEESLVGVAHAAHAAGIPFVVGMQQTILDRAAPEFARAFYHALVNMHPLEFCMAEGRVAIKDELGVDSAEWSIPVMFSNARPGCVDLLSQQKGHPKEYRINIVADQPQDSMITGIVHGNVIKNLSIGGSTEEASHSGARKRHKRK